MQSFHSCNQYLQQIQYSREYCSWGSCLFFCCAGLLILLNNEEHSWNNCHPHFPAARSNFTMLKLGHVWQCKKFLTGSCDCGAQNVRDLWRIWSSGCYDICFTQYAYAPEGVTTWDERLTWRLLILKCQRLSWLLSLLSPQSTAFSTWFFFFICFSCNWCTCSLLQYRLRLKQIKKGGVKLFKWWYTLFCPLKWHTYTQIILAPLMSTIAFPSCDWLQ
jgi:hypothetical protein